MVTLHKSNHVSNKSPGYYNAVYVQHFATYMWTTYGRHGGSEASLMETTYPALTPK